jgi:cytochrome c553
MRATQIDKDIRDAASTRLGRHDRGGRPMSTIIVAIVGIVLAAMSTTAISQDTKPSVKQQAEKKVVELCSVCHGPFGVSTSPEFPILAAQRRGYLETQLEMLRDRSRAEKTAHDFMWGIASGLDDATIDAIARYYAAQPPAPGTIGDPALIAKGKRIYEKADPERYMLACATCHGTDAEGARDFPRLAGQHAKYVAKQLQYIQQTMRRSPVMHGMISNLAPDDIEAVAIYVQSR